MVYLFSCFIANDKLGCIFFIVINYRDIVYMPIKYVLGILMYCKWIGRGFSFYMANQAIPCSWEKCGACGVSRHLCWLREQNLGSCCWTILIFQLFVV